MKNILFHRITASIIDYIILNFIAITPVRIALAKYSEYNFNFSFVDMAVITLYLVIIGLFFNNTTIGQRVTGLKTTSRNRENISINQIILKALVLSAMVFYFDIEIYTSGNRAMFNLTQMILQPAFLIYLALSQKFIGLLPHDMISGTKVVLSDEE